MNRLARVRNKFVKDTLIRQFVRAYPVDVDEVSRPIPSGFDSFNDFFTRSLHDDARPVDSDDKSVTSPADGVVSECGRLQSDQLLQAKGKTYGLVDLLATDTAQAAKFVDGSFATIYLAPHNYHRVHSPLTAKLTSLVYVPGDLYSVNENTARFLPRLFTRNERLVCHFEGQHGPFVLVMVGAMNVGTIDTIWTGPIRPQRRGLAQALDPTLFANTPSVDKGEMIGWFNMGSTVILLLPPQNEDCLSGLAKGDSVKVGEKIGNLPA